MKKINDWMTKLRSPVRMTEKRVRLRAPYWGYHVECIFAKLY